MAFTKEERIAFNVQLIRAVEAKELIWNTKLPGHKNPQIIANLWQKIADELNISVKVAADRWTNLRDTYKRLKKKFDTEKQSGTEEHSSVRWPHFHQMSFLTPSDIPSTTIEEITVEESERSSSMSPFEMYVEYGENTSIPGVSNVDSIEPPVQSPPEKRPKTKTKSWDSVFEQFLSNQQQQIEHQLSEVDQQIRSRTQMDAFEMFLLSLAPYLRNTPPQLLPQLQINLIYITSEYRKGNIPTSLINL